MKSRFMLVLILMVTALSSQFTALAQTDAPIFFLMQGDIWSYQNGQLQQKTTWGFNQEPLLSPDGTRFAYLSLAQIGVDVYKQNNYIFAPEPTNVWLWTIATGDAVRLVDQPATARVNADGSPENTIGRRSLAWSPNSQQLTWVEIDASTYKFSLVVYDIASRTQRTLSTAIPYPYADAGFIGGQPVHWGAGGIALENTGIGENPPATGSPFESTLSIYDPQTGALIARNVVGNNSTTVVDFFWNNANEIVLQYLSGERVLYYVNTGGLVGAGELELYNPFATKPSLNLFVGKYLQNTSEQFWTIFWANGQPINFATQAISNNVALSPDGRAVAYVSDALYIWSDGNLLKVPGTEGVKDTYPKGVIWGVNTWRMVGQVNPGLPNNNCALVPRLVLGADGMVIEGLGNNVLRDKPGKNVDGSKEIGAIPPGGTFTILAGPECMSGYNWWQVNYNGQIGWTAEGENGVYWLQPLGIVIDG